MTPVRSGPELSIRANPEINSIGGKVMVKGFTKAFGIPL
jgi:hypothetical protein